MNYFRNLTRSLLYGAAVMACVMPPTAMAEAITLRLAHSGQDAESQHAAALEFARQVNLRTDAQVKIQVFAASELGNDNAAIAGVREGKIDMVMSGNPYFTGLAPRMNVLDLPYVFVNAKHAYKVLDGPIGRGLLGELEPKGLKGLAFLEVGFRNITNSVRPIRKPEDIKGLKLRTTPNPAHIKAFEVFGAAPSPMPIAEVYEKLKNKALDGQENPVTIVRNAKFYEVQKYMSLTRHAYTSMPLVINKARFEALTPAHQKVFMDAANMAANFHRNINRQTESTDIGVLRARGMMIEEFVVAEPFRAMVMEPIKQQFIEKHGTDLIDAVLNSR